MKHLPAVALLYLAAGCATARVETRPEAAALPEESSPPPSQPVAAGQPPKAGSLDARLAADSIADAAALDSLAELTAAGTPELELDETIPVWDLNVLDYSDHPRVQYYIDFFTTRGADRFQIWLQRMPRYEGMVRERLAAQGLPSDLIYLALIESGFSPHAVSRARAVGMWQFMQPTGASYGLRVNSWIDERRDPVKSTDAAARHLRDLVNRFGSHYLAAAAYNGGAGRVGRGLVQISAQLGAGDEAIDPMSDDAFFELAESRHIYQETKDYVPKLIAAALIAKEPDRYGFDAVDPVDPFPLDSVIVEGGTGLDVIARLAGTTLDEIRELNPHILRGVTPPGMKYPVRVPAASGPAVAEKYAALPPTERPAVLTHVVRRGETISGIAQRYGVSQDALMSANRVARARSLQIGATLYIPVSGSDIPESLLMEREPAVRSAVTHIVRRGETVGGIAGRYGVSQGTIIALNGLDRAGSIRAGQRLVIREATGGSRAASSTPAASARTHVVKAGDTVGGIARRYGVSQAAIIRENGLGSGARIKVGQRLRLPTG